MTISQRLGLLGEHRRPLEKGLRQHCMPAAPRCSMEKKVGNASFESLESVLEDALISLETTDVCN